MLFISSPPDMGVNNVAEGAEILGGGVACVDQEWQVWWGKVGFILTALGYGGLSGSESFTT